MEFKIIKYRMKYVVFIFSLFFACTPNQKTTQVEHSDVILNNEGDWHFSFKGLIFLDLIRDGSKSFYKKKFYNNLKIML